MFRVASWLINISRDISFEKFFLSVLLMNIPSKNRMKISRLDEREGCELWRVGELADIGRF